MRPFRSKAALATHFFQMHGRVARFRHFAFGDTCKACGRRFRGLQQLALHLRANSWCCDALSAAGLWSDAVLPGIGSSAWIEASRKDLGLTLPSEPTLSVRVATDMELAWEENSVLVTAFLSGAEKLLDLPIVDAEGAFQFCIDLSMFPLFPDELDGIAAKTHELLVASGVDRSVDLCDSVKTFFADSGMAELTEQLNHEVLEDVFWRSPGPVRPETTGDWLKVSSPSEGSKLHLVALESLCQMTGTGGTGHRGVRFRPGNVACSTPVQLSFCGICWKP